MTAFGDFQPEDGYDAGDPPDRRLAIIETILDDLSPGDLARLIDLARVINAFVDDLIGWQDRLQDLRERLDTLREE